MNEIRFRASEDKLYEELMKRREIYKHIGLLHHACDKCGKYNYVMCNLSNRTCECEGCWAKRRYLEILGEW